MECFFFGLLEKKKMKNCITRTFLFKLSSSLSCYARTLVIGDNSWFIHWSMIYSFIHHDQRDSGNDQLNLKYISLKRDTWNSYLSIPFFIIIWPGYVIDLGDDAH